MKKYILALILGFGIVLQGQVVCAQVEDVDSDNTPTIQTVDKNILLDEELMKTITPEQLEEYIAQGADVNARDKEGVTPLIYAATYENPEIIELLIKHGANVNAKEKDGHTPLMFALGNNYNLESIKVLMDAGADLHAKAKDGLTPLMVALVSNKLPDYQKSKIMKIILKSGADVNIKSQIGSLIISPLMFAILTNDTISINMLLEFGADVNIKGKRGVTPLMYAIMSDESKKMVLKMIHYKDIKISHQNVAEIVQVLINNGANVNAKFDGDLHILSAAASYTDNPKVIQILLDNGVKIEDGNKLLDLLDKNEYIEKNQDYWDLRDRIYNEMNN